MSFFCSFDAYLCERGIVAISHLIVGITRLESRPGISPTGLEVAVVFGLFSRRGFSAIVL